MLLVLPLAARYKVRMKSAAMLFLLAGILALSGCASAPPPAKQYKQTYSSFDQPSDHPANEVMPAGYINFSSADINQVLDIYAGVSQRNLLRGNLPSGKIVFKNGSSVNQIEMLQMFDTMLAKQNVVMIYSGDKTVKAVSLVELNGEVFPEINLPWQQLPQSSSPMQRKVWLKKQKPSVLVPMLMPLACLQGSLVADDDEHLLIIRDYSKNVREQL
jgi:type II secretory pathway component GspD/PulD (secretin)